MIAKETTSSISNFFKREPPSKRAKLLTRPDLQSSKPDKPRTDSPEPDPAFLEKLVTEYSLTPHAAAELVKVSWRDDNLPLSSKYQPERLIEVVQHLETRHIKGFLKVFADRAECLVLDDKPQALLIKGPPGCGKTSLVRAACRDLDLKLIELNASCTRSGAALQRVIGESTQTYSVLYKQTPTVVLLDDVDVILDSDKGFFKALLELVAQTKSPIVVTCSKL
jgi:chromosomal replication initiation ATPase DnaA